MEDRKMKRRIKIGLLLLIMLSISIFIIRNETTKNKVEPTVNYFKVITSISNEIKPFMEEYRKIEEIKVTINSQKEFYKNNEIMGLLNIPNTDLNLPFAKTTDNDYYLNHSLYKQEDIIGSVFLDFRNKLTDRKLLFYGHNSQNLITPFRTLEGYLNKDFYNNHPTIELTTEEGKRTYQIFSVVIATTDFQHVHLSFNEEEWIKHISWLNNNSIYDTNIKATSNDKIIILQTCNFSPVGSYLLIIAKEMTK